MLRDAASAEPLESDEEQALARAAQLGDAQAFDRLVRAHLRLVFAIAGEYRRFGSSMNDLVSEGMLGLVTAARRFDPERGARLAVYSAHWIRSFLRRYTLSSRRIVGPPSTRNGRYLLANLARAERDLTEANGGTEPDREALAAHLGVSVSDVDEVKGALQTRDAWVSDGLRDERGGVELASPDPDPEAYAEQLEEQQRVETLLSRAFEQLGARERDIVRARHLESEPPTLAELGVGLGISRERVRQIELRGYHKLRDAVLDSVA
jgi:RNA polymerase sigma-32 factor